MLIGNYLHTVDDKGRLFIPAKLREALAFTFIITKGLDNCLYGYSMDEWKTFEEKLSVQPTAKARNISRFLFASAVSVTADKQGRVVLPASLRSFAGLTKDVVIVGVGQRIEIWDNEKWLSICDSISSEEVAATMDELGF